MNDEILHKYWQYLCGKYRKKNTRRTEYTQVKYCLEWINKPVREITEDDLIRWKAYIMEKYKQNGNTRRVSSVNRFFKWLGREDLKLQVPKQELVTRVVLSEKELEAYLEASKTDPLWHLIALLQIDGILRPSEFGKIKLSNLDLENQKLYLEDTKTGNNSIILSPRLTEAIKNYLPYRDPLPEYRDYLIIVPYGKYKGRPPTAHGDFIRNITSRIALKAEIRKRVTPYTIKPSAITNYFNQQLNPKIIQRMARHKKIETTLRYDHVSDEMVRRQFELRDFNIKDLDREEKARLLFNRYLSGELDLEMLKQGLELLSEERKHYENIAYV